MTGYFGTEEQQALQARAEASVADIAATPGLCQNGRMLGCDDVEALGWGSIHDILNRDGFIGFRLLGADWREELSARLAEWGYRLDTWDLFIGARELVEPACLKILAQPLPQTVRSLPKPTEAEAPYTQEIQRLIASSGIMPFSGSLLIGSAGPATTVVIGRAQDDLAAVAHSYLPHNAHSRYSSYAWGGLVSVKETDRGKGLGRAINALACLAAFGELSATHIYEMITSTNVPSRGMAEACGLMHDPGFLCGVATPNDRERYTR